MLRPYIFCSNQMNRKIFFLIFVLLVIMACNHPLQNRSSSTNVPQPNQSSVQTGSMDKPISSGGATRHYILHVPSSYQQGNAFALIFNFHCYGSNSQQQENLTGMSAKTDH